MPSLLDLVSQLPALERFLSPTFDAHSQTERQLWVIFGFFCFGAVCSLGTVALKLAWKRDGGSVEGLRLFNTVERPDGRYIVATAA